MKPVASNPRIEIALRQRQMRCYLGHGAMKRIIEASVLRRRRKDRLRRSNE